MRGGDGDEARPRAREARSATDGRRERKDARPKQHTAGGASEIDGVRVKKQRKGQGQMKARKRAKIGKRRKPSR